MKQLTYFGKIWYDEICIILSTFKWPTLFIFLTLLCGVTVFMKNNWNSKSCFVGLFCSVSGCHTTPVVRRVVLELEHFPLTGGNWQKWKRVFLTCPCHEIYRNETVGLKSCKNTWKITIFVKMWNLGQYRENLIFCQKLLN